MPIYSFRNGIRGRGHPLPKEAELEQVWLFSALFIEHLMCAKHFISVLLGHLRNHDSLSHFMDEETKTPQRKCPPPPQELFKGKPERFPMEIKG